MRATDSFPREQRDAPDGGSLNYEPVPLFDPVRVTDNRMRHGPRLHSWSIGDERSPVNLSVTNGLNERRTSRSPLCSGSSRQATKTQTRPWFIVGERSGGSDNACLLSRPMGRCERLPPSISRAMHRLISYCAGKGRTQCFDRGKFFGEPLGLERGSV